MIKYRQDLLTICDQNSYSDFFNHDCRNIIELLEEKLEEPIYISEDNEEFILPVINKYIQTHIENFSIEIDSRISKTSIFYRRLLLNEKQFKGLIFSLSINDNIPIYEEEYYNKITIPSKFKKVVSNPYGLDKEENCIEVYINITHLIPNYPISFNQLCIVLGIEQFVFFNHQNIENLFGFSRTTDEWHKNSVKMMNTFQQYVVNNLTSDQRDKIIIWGSIVLYGSGSGYPDDIDFIVDCKGDFPYDFIKKMQNDLSQEIPKIDAGIMISNDLVLRGDKNFKPDTPENTIKTVYLTPRLTGAKSLEYLIENPRFHHMVLGLKTVSVINTLKRYFIRGSPKDLTKIVMVQKILGVDIGPGFCLSLHDKFGRSYFYKDKFLSISRIIMEKWYGFYMTDVELNESFRYCPPNNSIINIGKNKFLDKFVNENVNRFFENRVLIIGNSDLELGNFNMKNPTSIEFISIDDLSQMTYNNSSFDTILLFFTLCMVIDRKKLIKSCYNTLTKNGTLMIMMFDGSYIKNNIKQPRIINRINMRNDEYTKIEDEIFNKYSVPNISINYPNSEVKLRIEYIDKETDLFGGSIKNPGIAIFYSHIISRVQYLVYPGSVIKLLESGFHNINNIRKSKNKNTNFVDCLSLIIANKS